MQQHRIKYMDDVEEIGHSLVVILVGVIVVAIIAVVVSQHSATSNAISQFFRVFNRAVNVAASPIG